MVELDDAGGESPTKMLAWNDALAISDSLMQKVDCYTVRYRVHAGYMHSLRHSILSRRKPLNCRTSFERLISAQFILNKITSRA
ncbi:hypothetical protein GQ37_005990 [Janthinobacterium sp. BJB1]|nr:hypothetical protein GQ37_005990 [Janthinobacterium sp. BJB1]